MRFPVLIALLAVPLVACEKSPSVQSVPSAKSQISADTSPTTAEPQVQACSLLTKDEVAAIQKTPITGAQSNQSSDGTYVISLCYYSSGEPNKSVSFTLTEPDRKHPPNSDPRNYWNETFGKYASGKDPDAALERDEKKEAKPGRKEEEEKVTPPKRIEGIGEQAFWAGNRFGGALYVLKEHYILRISVGGPDNEETKISKSKALAEKALARL
jgi:hypothetical protein